MRWTHRIIYIPLANVNAVKCCISLYRFARPLPCIHYIYIYIYIVIRTPADYYIYDSFFIRHYYYYVLFHRSSFAPLYSPASRERIYSLLIQRTFNIMRRSRRVHGENNIITIIITDRKPRVFYPYTKLCIL
jgi:hypothetical protein